MLPARFLLRTYAYPRTTHTRTLRYVLSICLTLAGCSESGQTREMKVSSAGLAKINAEMDMDWLRLKREDFANADRFTTFLQVVVSIHYGTGGYLVGSSAGLRMIETDISAWLNGTEKNEMVLRNLCHDPQFAFTKDVWTVSFNVLKPSGGVDRWRMTGEHNPRINTSLINEIEISPLKPDGTFVCALLS